NPHDRSLLLLIPYPQDASPSAPHSIAPDQRATRSPVRARKQKLCWKDGANNLGRLTRQEEKTRRWAGVAHARSYCVTTKSGRGPRARLQFRLASDTALRRSAATG